MKKRSLYLVAILTVTILFISSFRSCAQEICLPETIVTQIIDELLVKDGLEYTVSKQDSIIRVYEHKDSTQTVQIRAYKLNAEEYEKVIKNLEELSKIDTATIKDLKKLNRKIKFKTTLIIIGQAVIIVILLLHE